MMAWQAIGAFVLGLALLVFGSDWLVKGAARLASRLGMSPFAIGVTVVAFGTSTPELFASVRAALAGVSDLAVGNVLGSNIANVCLILGATALIQAVRVERAVMRLELPVMLGITLIAGMTLMDGVVTRVEGGALAAGLIAYVVFAYKVGKADPELSVEIGQEGAAEAAPDAGAPASRDFALILSGLVALGAGAWLLVWGRAISRRASWAFPPRWSGSRWSRSGRRCPSWRRRSARCWRVSRTSRWATSSGRTSSTC